MTLAEITEFAKNHEYDAVKQLEDWHDFKVYEPLFSGNEYAMVGLPLVILVRDDQIRMSTADEALQIIDDMDE